MNYLTVCDKRLPKGYYTPSRRKIFKTERDSVFGGRSVPANSTCQFFETRNFGFLIWVEPNGARHIASK
jgi:hypothetical protein